MEQAGFFARTVDDLDQRLAVTRPTAADGLDHAGAGLAHGSHNRVLAGPRFGIVVCHAQGIQLNGSGSVPQERTLFEILYDNGRCAGRPWGLPAIGTARTEGVLRALDRLADGTYGIDEVTGRPIPGEVLENDPTARRS